MELHKETPMILGSNNYFTYRLETKKEEQKTLSHSRHKPAAS